MQSKINSFFKPCSSSTKFTPNPSYSPLNNIFNEEEEDDDDFTKEPDVPIIYTRRSKNVESGDDDVLGENDSNKLDFRDELIVANSKRVLNKKRKFSGELQCTVIFQT
nr:protein chromosome transmission fidelity 7-like [Tanacetum cinerariifolium]